MCMNQERVFNIGCLAEKLGGRVVGDSRRSVYGVGVLEAPDVQLISVVWEKSIFQTLPVDIPVVAPEGWIADGRDGIEVADPRGTMPVLLSLFDPRCRSVPGVHPSAIVAPDAEVDSGATIGPGCVIGEGVRIGKGAVLEAMAFVGPHSRIGSDCRIEPHVTLYQGTILGERVILHSGVVIGADGFGFVMNPTSGHVKIPQIGGVKIGDDVEIGACSTVDRGTVGNTVIGAGTKMDDHVHVGHNARVGKNCILVAMTGVGGSSVIEDNVVMAAKSGSRDHARVGRGAQVAAMSGVVRDVPAGLMVSGFPARDHRDELKIQAATRKLPDLMKRVRALEKSIARLEEGEEE